MTRPDDDRAAPSALAYSLALLLTAGCALLAIWIPPWPVGTDTPTHIAHAALLAHPDRAAELLSRSFALTSQLFVVLAAPLTRLFELSVAARVALSALLLVSMLCAWSLGRSGGVQRPPGPFFAAVAGTSGFMAVMGFDNFSLGAALGCLLLPAARVWLRSRRNAHLLGLVLLAVLVAYAHIIAFGMSALWTVAAVALLDHRRSGIRTGIAEATRVAAAMIPAGVFAVASVYMTYTAQAERGVTEGLGVQRLAPLVQLEQLASLPFAASTPFGVALTAVGVALLAQSNARLWLLVAMFVPLYLLVPWHMPGWAFAQPRVVIPLVMLPLFVVGWGRFPRAALVVVCVVASAIPLIGLRATLPVSRSVADAVAAMGEAPPGRTMTVRLTNGATPRLRWAEPLLHVDDWVLAFGGATPSAVDLQPFIHSLLPQQAQWPPAPPMYFYRSLDCSINPNCSSAPALMVDRVALQGLAFETVLVVPPDAAFTAALQRRGYTQLSAARLRPNPASLRIEIPPDSERALGGGLLVSISYPQTLGTIAAPMFPTETLSNVSRTPIGPLPAGATYVSIVLTRPEMDPEVLFDERVQLVAGQTYTIQLPALPGRPDVPEQP
jgi:hypothetical protein